MAGPAVGLLLFQELDDGRWGDLLRWLEGFCDLMEAAREGVLSFVVRDRSALGMPEGDTGTACGFLLSLDPLSAEDDEDYSVLGRLPVQELVLSADCSGRVNHTLLGYLALALARRFDALIDFGGVLGYRESLKAGPDEVRVGLARARVLVASLSGVIREVPYTTWDGRRCFSHVGDATFLSAWLRHSDFAMLK
jgi:hypothetical protein